MIILRGIGISPGIAIGKAVSFFDKQDAHARTAGTPEQEWNTFLSAQEAACAELSYLAEKAGSEAGAETALLFEVHCEMAKDPDFCDCVKDALESGKDAVSAVKAAGEKFAAVFEGMDNDYMKARAADVRDVAARLCRIMSGEAECFTLAAGSVVVAEDMSLSVMLNLNKSLLSGFATEKGSPVSHAAILARTLGIPAVAGLGDALTAELAGKSVILDGNEGKLIIEPDDVTLERYLQEEAACGKEKSELAALIGKETVTRSGKRIALHCNIGSPEDIAAVLENDGEGIGLFRSELLFLGKSSAPSEEEQFEAYKSVLSALNGKPVIVRTMDIGADKDVGYFGLSEEANPALGLRGLRLSLERRELFKTQLRSLYRASAYGNLSIMFPMVASLWEVEAAKAICEEVQRELRRDGIVFSENVRIGIMVETPAAALISAELAENADFFSVGTNDLSQYTLACDRQNGNTASYYDPHHPAIFTLLRIIAENAHRAGIPVAVCGELAADESMTDFFLEIGIDELSVNPASVLPLRKAIRD